MKISQKQASLLAKEVFKKLMDNNVAEVPENTVAKIREFKERRQQLLEVCNKADNELKKHDTTFDKIIGPNVRAYATNSEESILKDIKRAATPSLDEIENRIILNAMFSTDDLNAFIDKIVEDFTPKKKSKLLPLNN